MRIKRSAEMSWDSSLREYFFDLIENRVDKYFVDKNYGEDIDKIFILLICRPGASNFSIRKRYHVTPKEKWIGIDCILNYAKIVTMNSQQEKIYLLNTLKETFNSIQTYKRKLKHFDFEKFSIEIGNLIQEELEKQSSMPAGNSG
jgi:hypothetical protein